MQIKKKVPFYFSSKCLSQISIDITEESALWCAVSKERGNRGRNPKVSKTGESICLHTHGTVNSMSSGSLISLSFQVKEPKKAAEGIGQVRRTSSPAWPL